MSDILSWLLTPISGAQDHIIATEIAWHGRLMVLAWAIVMPAAFVIARFYKITPRQDWPRRLDNPFWFVTHRRLGNAIGGITLVALALAVWFRGLAFLDNYHTVVGWLIVLLTVVQVGGALLRGTHGGPVNPFTRQPRPVEQWPGDHFSLTRRRIVFEYTHKTAGYLLVVLTVMAIASGLKAADAPRWMWIVIGLWGIACVAAVAWLQMAGKCIDTYQAIWGLDGSLPGFRRKPIGIGITRLPLTVGPATVRPDVKPK